MALAVTDFSNVNVFPLGNSKYLITGKYTGPASYASGGEILTQTKCKQAFQGIEEIDFLVCSPAFPPSGGATGTVVAFEPINDGTNAGKFHFYNDTPAHTHNILLKGGLTIGDAVGQSATQVFGKASATDATIASSATNGGVVATADLVNATEVASSTDLSTLACWFIGQGIL